MLAVKRIEEIASQALHWPWTRDQSLFLQHIVDLPICLSDIWLVRWTPQKSNWKSFSLALNHSFFDLRSCLVMICTMATIIYQSENYSWPINQGSSSLSSDHVSTFSQDLYPVLFICPVSLITEMITTEIQIAMTEIIWLGNQVIVDLSLRYLDGGMATPDWLPQKTI